MLQKNACETYQNLSEEVKKSNNMVVNNIKISKKVG